MDDGYAGSLMNLDLHSAIVPSLEESSNMEEQETDYGCII